MLRCSPAGVPPLAPARLRPRRPLPPPTRTLGCPRPPPPPPRGPAPPRAVAEGDDSGRPLSPTTLLLRLVIAALVATVATVIATPTLLSTRRGRGLLLAAVNARLSPHSCLTIDAASLSWRAPPLLHGVRLTDERGVVVASADRVSASGSLAAVVAAIARWRPPWRWPLRRRHRRVTPPSVDVIIDAPKVDLSVAGDAGGLTALQRALGGRPPPRVADSEGDLLSGVPSDGGGGVDTPPPPPFGPPVDVTFSAEARIGDARLVVARGTATLPADAAEAVGGGPVHGVLLVGRDGIAADAIDALSPRLEDGSAALDDGDASASSPYSTSWIHHPPRGAGAPFALEVRSPSAAVTVDGWRRARRGVELRGPAVARARLTPALARHGLSRLSPLLASGADVSSEGPVVVAIGERGARLPARRVSARVEPLTLRVRTAPRAQRGPSRGLAAAALDWLGEATGGRGGGAVVVARTSGADVEIVVGGAITCRRIDVLLSPAGTEQDASAGVHLFTYGAVDGRRCAATLGVPGATLARAGFRGVPPHTALRVAVRGPVSHPRVDWVAASADAAALAAASAAAAGEDDGGGAVGAVKRLLLAKAASRLRRGRPDTQPAVPPPNDLPWAPGPPRQIDAVLKRQAAEKVGT